MLQCVSVFMHARRCRRVGHREATRGEDVLYGTTGTGATRTVGLGHAELGQRDWDRRYRDILFCFL